jgi:hypothetical protein
MTTAGPVNTDANLLRIPIFHLRRMFVFLSGRTDFSQRPREYSKYAFSNGLRGGAIGGYSPKSSRAGTAWLTDELSREEDVAGNGIHHGV